MAGSGVFNSRFAGNASARTANRQPTLSPQQALERYAEERRLLFDESITLATTRSAEVFVFHGGNLADGNIPVSLAWLEHDGQLRLVWDLAVDEKGRPDWFNAWVDAHSGEVLRAVNWTQEAGYRVFAAPLEHPGEGPDSLVIDPQDDVASRLGWHDTGSNQYTDTRGNNVFAQEDTDANNSGGRRPDGGDDRLFDFPVDLETQQPPDYEAFAVTNLFYWNNLTHDVLWHYGFDEPAGNFQVNNFAQGGQGGDPVRADAQDGSGTSNANFSTPPDGNPPRMQMFIWPPGGGNPAELRVAEPAASAGTYAVATAGWGAEIGDPGNTAILELVNDGSLNGSEGCASLTGFTPGRIALVRRGSCEFGLKGLNAEQAGAIAMIVINSTPGNETIPMGAGDFGNQVTIPVAMIGNNDGNVLVDDLADSPEGTLIREQGPPILDRDSDLDAGVIAHEYGHGLSIRLTGGPSTSSCLFGAQQAGEGWSDFLGMWLTAKPDDVIDAPRGIGSYLIFQENIPGAGIRPAPYTRDMAINPLTYETVRNAGQPGGVSIPHGVGTVFNTMLWDLYSNLVEKHGFDEERIGGSGGNNIALQLVIDALKLQPCGPTFLDNRDATLLADEINNDGANRCEIWDAFARRGAGVNASDGGNSQSLDVVADFSVPEICAAPEVRLFKHVEPPVFKVAGDELVYTFSIENTGPVALESVSLDDPMLGGSVACQDSELEPGQTITCGPVAYTVTDEDVEAGEILNEATVSAEADGGEAVFDEAEVVARDDQAFRDRFEAL